MPACRGALTQHSVRGVLPGSRVPGSRTRCTRARLAAAADVEGEAWREFTLAWWDAHGPAATHVSALTELCEKQDLMLQVRGDGNTRSQQSRLGRALHSARDRVFGDLQVVVVNHDRQKRTLYALKRLGDHVAQLPPPVTERADDDRDEVDPWQ